MKKIALDQTLDRAYSAIDDNIIELKSAMIGLCTDIERYFRVAFDINLNEEIDERSFKYMVYTFPQFARLTIEQMNKYISLFVAIRNVNAHLYLSRPIYINDDLRQFIIDNTKPSYPIEKNKRITVYGMVFVVMMLSQKYMVWPFCTSFFRHGYIVGIAKGEPMSQFQITQQRIFNSICGQGKPLKQNSENISSSDYIYTNDVLKHCLTYVFFDLESALKKYKKSNIKSPSLSSMLRSNPLFDEELISKIVKLRNYWFHGTFIGDVIKENDGIFEFNLEYAISIISEITEVAKKDLDTFNQVVYDISFFAQSFFDYYVLRLIELSFEILDCRLLTEDKLESRLNKIDNAYQRFASVDTNLFNMFGHLLNKDVIRWNLSASKFLDKLPRKFDSANIKIAKIHCNNGFTIGKFKTNRTNIVLALIDIEKYYKNPINKKDFSELVGSVERRRSEYITVIEVEL